MNKIKNTSIAFILILSVGIYEYSSACEEHQKQNSKSVSLPGASIYNLNSSWSDQDNHAIKLESLAGKPRFVAMIYTKCQTACPLLVQDIQAVTSRLSKSLASKINVDVFSFDSESENAKSLQAFKVKYHLSENWTAYYGSKSSVAELAAALGIQYKRLPSGDYIHSNVFFFVNEKGEIMAKQEGLGQDVSTFIKKIESLM